MKLPQFIDALISAMQYECSPKDVDVVITTNLPYITCGQRPCTGVAYVGMGFDWESGQFRIEPEEKLMPIKDAIPQKVILWRDAYHCPKCEHMLGIRKKTDIRFCSSCGQAVRWE